MDNFKFDPRSPWPESDQRRFYALGLKMRRAVDDKVFAILAAEAGLALEPWQEALLDNALADRYRRARRRRRLSDPLEKYLQEICS